MVTVAEKNSPRDVNVSQVYLVPGLDGSQVVAPLLDGVSGVTNAYSLRRLLNSYTGNAIRVERDSDSTQQDIGFTASGDLDTASLLAFVGAGNGYVQTWYDQAGSLDISAGTSTSAKIVDSGSLVTDGIRASMVVPWSTTTGFITTAIPRDWKTILLATTGSVPENSTTGHIYAERTVGVNYGFRLARASANDLYLFSQPGSGATTETIANAWTAGSGYHNIAYWRTGSLSPGGMELRVNNSIVYSSLNDSRISGVVDNTQSFANLREIVFFNEDVRSELASLHGNLDVYYV